MALHCCYARKTKTDSLSIDIMNLIIDGNNLAMRAHFKLPYLKSNKGQHTGLIHGFLVSLLCLIRDHKPDNVIVVFDGGRAKWRMELYPEYKANRGESEKKLIVSPQIEILKKDILPFLPWALACQPGVEADDLIARYVIDLVKKANAKPEDNLVYTNDEDFYQLFSFTRILNAKSKILDKMHLLNGPMNCTPDEFLFAKSIAGDSSDNIKGITKVGPITAMKMVKSIVPKTVHDLITDDAMPHYRKFGKCGISMAGNPEDWEISKAIIYRNYQMMDLFHRCAPVPLPMADWTAPRCQLNKAVDVLMDLDLQVVASRIQQVLR